MTFRGVTDELVVDLDTLIAFLVDPSEPDADGEAILWSRSWIGTRYTGKRCPGRRTARTPSRLPRVRLWNCGNGRRVGVTGAFHQPITPDNGNYQMRQSARMVHLTQFRS